MNLGSLLKTFIYLISSSLFYPVLFILVVFTFVILFYSGSIFSEWVERMRLKKNSPQKLPGILKSDEFTEYVSVPVRSFVHGLDSIPEQGEAETENLLQETTHDLNKSLDKLYILVRVCPGLGLIGTLIPMGRGLAALGQGDMSALTSQLVIAFTTTVVGLAQGLVAFFFYTVKRRWVERDIKNIELAAEVRRN
ncbi:MAG: MotA/TolQ/ExbB proton channel family protein [Thermodesulfobacteriota bacterium]